jgi:hypothetical protein
MAHPGCYASNFHESRRSEYLALYFFSSLGTAVQVPAPEDTGLDLHCTIAEVVGLRAWPLCFYSVQVKSEMKPWSIDSAESVQWLAEQPFPIFLCIVEKAAGRFRLYQTLPRHLLRAHSPLPDRIELAPEDLTDGRPTLWERGKESLSLSAPILDFTLDKFLDETFISKAKSIIQQWVLWDNENIHMRKSGTPHALMPNQYKTNQKPDATGSMQQRLIARGEGLRAAVDNLSRILLWTASCMSYTGQQGLAVRMALLLRRLGVDCTFKLSELLQQLCSHLGLPQPEHVDSWTAGLDAVDAAIEEMLPDAWKGDPLVPTSGIANNP